MTSVRVLFHRSEGTSPEGLDEALAVAGEAEFYVGPVRASRLAFTLRRAGLAITVHDDVDHRIGRFADPAQAVAHGFANFDQSRRGRRRATRERLDAVLKAEPNGPAMRYDQPDRFIRALAAGAIVDMFDGPEDAPRLAFRMKSGGRAIHVVTPQGEVVGTFATAMAAAVHGFTRLDREARRWLEALSPDQP